MTAKSLAMVAVWRYLRERRSFSGITTDLKYASGSVTSARISVSRQY